MPTTKTADVVIIGGGIIGAAIARELSKYRLTVVLIEREPDLSTGATKANSGIIHAGFDPEPSSLKGRTNARGNLLYHRLEKELDLEVRWTGSLVVAKTEGELQILRELLARGRQNGVPELEIISGEQVLAREPNLARNITAALWAPTAGVIAPFTAALSFAECAVQNGVRILLNCAAEGFVLENGRIAAVNTNKGQIAARYVINAAGLDAASVSRLAGDDSFTLTPRRGEYLLFDHACTSRLVNTIVFPVPHRLGKGVLVAPTYNGEVFIGPNAENLTGGGDTETTLAGLEFIVKDAGKILPDIPVSAVIAQFAGLRAVAGNDDFIIEHSRLAPGLIQAAGMQSPGLTCAPAVAELITGLLREAGLVLAEKTDFNGAIPPRIRLRHLDCEQKAALIQENPLYGRIICRCETISEAEITAAIHSPCGAKTLDGLKRRVRAGAGRCQSGFCGPRTAGILARELGVGLDELIKEGADSKLYFKKN